MAQTGVNVKMGVSGVSQFKQDINTVKESMKTLDKQLELVEKQYKATGDKEAYMREKAELLHTKLEQQKTSEVADRFAKMSVWEIYQPMIDKVTSGYSLNVEME